MIDDYAEGFVELGNGFLMWNTPVFTFLIGDTNEMVRHVALWVSPVSTLFYRMVKRVLMDNEMAFDGLKTDAEVLVVRSKTMGVAGFIKYINDCQKRMDEMMSLASLSSFRGVAG